MQFWQRKRGQMTSRGRNHARNGTRTGQNIDACAHIKGVAVAGGALPTLPIGQPKKAIVANGPHKITEFIRMGS